MRKNYVITWLYLAKSFMKTNSKLIVTLFLGVLMGALDISIVGPAIPSIEKSMHVPDHAIGWIFSIYVLFNLVGISLFARLSDIFGRRSIYMLAVFLFAIGSLWVGFSNNFTQLLIGRSIQGFGASGIFPVAAAVIGDKFPVEQRGKMLGLIGMVFGIAFIIGPVFAGTILHFASWNLLFFINIPIAIYLLISSYRNLPYKPTSNVFKLDWKGIVLLGLFLSSFSIALNGVNTSDLLGSVKSSRFLILLGFAVLTAIIFVWIERKETQPILSLQYFKKTQVVIASLLSIGTGFFQALFTFLPKLAVGALKVTPAKASFLLIPAVIATAAGAPIFGRMLDKAGSRIVIMLAMIFMTIGFTLAYFLTESFYLFYVAGIFVGLSLSILSGSALRYIVLNEVPPAERASGQGLVTIFISTGQMVSATILGSIIASSTTMVTGYKNSFLFLLLTSVLLLFASNFLKRKSQSPK